MRMHIISLSTWRAVSILGTRTVTCLRFSCAKDFLSPVSFRGPVPSSPVRRWVWLVAGENPLAEHLDRLVADAERLSRHLHTYMYELKVSRALGYSRGRCSTLAGDVDLLLGSDIIHPERTPAAAEHCISATDYALPRHPTKQERGYSLLFLLKKTLPIRSKSRRPPQKILHTTDAASF